MTIAVSCECKEPDYDTKAGSFYGVICGTQYYLGYRCTTCKGFQQVQRPDIVFLEPKVSTSATTCVVCQKEIEGTSTASVNGHPVHSYCAVRYGNTESILLEAESLTEGARNADYGHPLDDYTRTSAIWTAILSDVLKPGASITPELAALCMVGVKISRECHRPKRDNRVDGAGYFKLVDMIYSERERRK